MQINSRKIVLFIPIVIIITLTIICRPIAARGASQVITDKNVYNYGEPIKVNFSNAPGVDGDWICIVPAGSPDTEGGDYKYIPKGVNQGVLTFDKPTPGKYEARAYYNYPTKGYVVSARSAFSVKGGAAYEKEMSLRMERMERKANASNNLEANLAAGNGLVYIFREPYLVSANQEAQIMANGKPIVVLLNTSYFLFSVPAGDVKFTIGSVTEYNVMSSKTEETQTYKTSEETIKVKAGYVYYLKAAVVGGGYVVSLENVPHEEGANLIAKYKLTILK